MNKLKCTMSYDGTNFSGFQIQPEKRTIQSEVEAALTRMHKGQPIRVHSSGRTDKGVHAKRQVIHFETPLDIPNERWKKALNALLPADIMMLQVEHVPTTFHARYDAIEKEYRYFITNTKERNIFQRHYMYFDPTKMDMEKLKQACKKFEGTHDFTSFCSARTTIKGSKVRTLYEVKAYKQDNIIEIIFRGNGFLYNMVRIIVGVLLDVAKGKLELEAIDTLFAEKNRENVGVTIPPEGLYLWNVIYEKSESF